MRVDDGRSQAAKEQGELDDQARPQSTRSSQIRHRPAQCLDVFRQLPSRTERDEPQVESYPIAMTRKFDEQLLLAPHVKPEADMGHSDQ